MKHVSIPLRRHISSHGAQIVLGMSGIVESSRERERYYVGTGATPLPKGIGVGTLPQRRFTGALSGLKPL